MVLQLILAMIGRDLAIVDPCFDWTWSCNCLILVLIGRDLAIIDSSFDWT